MYWHEHMTAGGWIFSILGTLIVIALLVFAVMWLASHLGEGRPPSVAAGPSAREILDRRLASGELSVEQYQRLRDTLDAAGNGAAASEQPPLSTPG